jgi:hypothetical protein
VLVGVIQAGPDEGGHAAVNNNEVLVAVGLHTCTRVCVWVGGWLGWWGVCVGHGSIHSTKAVTVCVGRGGGGGRNAVSKGSGMKCW